MSGEACVEEFFAFHQPWSLLPFAPTGKIEAVSFAQSAHGFEFQPASPCSYAELQNAEMIARTIESAGRPVLWRSIWVRTATELLAAATSVAATLAGLVALRSPLVAGIALTLLLTLWSLQLGRLPSPLARLCPTAATQDLLAPDSNAEAGSRESVLLLVRTDLPAQQSGPISLICKRADELTWVIIALTLGAVAARALEAPEGAIGVIQSVPALASLALLAAVLIGSAVTQPPISYDLTAVGATGLGGASRALNADSKATTAWRCWEFSSAQQLRAAIEAAA